jgi:hypothetical protein
VLLISQCVSLEEKMNYSLPYSLASVRIGDDTMVFNEFLNKEKPIIAITKLDKPSEINIRFK